MRRRLAAALAALVAATTAQDAWVVVVEADGESVGALALGASLRGYGTRGALVAFVGPRVRDGWVAALERFGYEVVPVAGRGGASRAAFGAAMARGLSRFAAAVVVDPASLAVAGDVDALFDCRCGYCAVHDGAAASSAPGGPVVVARSARGAAPLGPALAACAYVDPAAGAACGGGCARLPSRYAASPLLLLLNGGPGAATRLVRTANAMPPAWEAARAASLARLAFGDAAVPWAWWAAPLLPLHGRWRAARAAAADTAGGAAAAPSPGRVAVAVLGAPALIAALACAAAAAAGPRAPRRRARAAPGGDAAAGQAALAVGAAVARAWVGCQAACLAKAPPDVGAAAFLGALLPATAAAFVAFQARRGRAPPRSFAREALALAAIAGAAALFPYARLRADARRPVDAVDAALPPAAAALVFATAANVAFLRAGAAARAAGAKGRDEPDGGDGGGGVAGPRRRRGVG